MSRAKFESSGGLSGAYVVTGAASGIGRAVVECLLSQGCSVWGTDLNEAGLRELEKNADGRFCWAAGDVLDEKLWSHDAHNWASRQAGVRGLVYAAGILRPGRFDATPPAIFSEQLDEQYRVHVHGLHRAIAALLPRLRQSCPASIVAVTSNAGTTPRVGMASYCVSKAAARMLIQCLALELGPEKIRCNSVSPGSTATSMLESLVGGRDFSGSIRGDLSSFRGGIPLGRVATAEDIAQAACFLLSPAARHITGHDLRVDGGATWS